MRLRSVSRYSVACAAFVVVAGMLPLGGAGALDEGIGSHPAMTKIAQCVSERRNLLVEFLMDESNSLKEEETTDPEARRVVAGRAALVGLTQFANTSGTRVAVDLAGFASEYSSQSDGWQALSNRSLSRLKETMNQFAERDDIDETNYAVALEGARAAFATGESRFTEGGVPPCKMLLWFTDGKLSVKGTNGGTANARDRICNGGIVSDLRSAGVVTIAVALDRNGSLDGDNRAKLEDYASGSSGACGGGGGETVGAVVSVDNLDDLIEFFDRIGTIGGDAIGDTIQRPVCRNSKCDAGMHSFSVEPWMGRVHAFGQVTSGGTALGLQLPGTDARTIEYAEALEPLTLDGVTVDVNWIDDHTVTVDAVPTSSQAKTWAGTWGLYFVSPDPQAGATARTEVYLFSGLAPALDSESVVRIGEPSKIVIQVTANDGVPASPEDLEQQVQLSKVVLSDPAGGSQTITVGRARRTPRGISFEVPVNLPAGVPAGVGTVQGTLDLGTNGKKLSQEFLIDVDVRLPAVYPQVQRPEVRTDAIVGSDPVTATVRVEAGTSPGEICYDAAASNFNDLPHGVGRVTPRLIDARGSGGTCRKLGVDQQGKFEFTLSPDGAGIGNARGELTFRSSVEGETEKPQQVVKVTVPMTRPVDEGTRWVVVFLLMVVGIGFPLLLLWLVARLQSRFRPTQGIRMVSIPVRVTTSRVHRRSAAGDSPLDVDPDTDVQWFRPASEKPESTIDVASTPRIRLAAVKPRSPFGYPAAVASADGDVVVSSEGGSSGHDSTIARMPLTLPGTWLFVRSGVPAAGDDGSVREVDGHLVLFLSATNFFFQVERLLAQAQDRLPLFFETLARRPEPATTAPEPPLPVTARPSAPADPFDGAQPSSDLSTPATPASPPWDDAPPWSDGGAAAGGPLAPQPPSTPPSPSTSSDPGFEPPPWA